MRTTFTCNICGYSSNECEVSELSRETGACKKCGSIVRLRAMIHLLSRQLFGKSLPVPQWPRGRKIAGYGVSDWPKFGEFLSTRVEYTSLPDITAPDGSVAGKADFVLCSDVLEHVAPPVERGFDGLFALLKPGGTLVLSVPYTFERTVEHFPSLYRWSLEERGGRQTLVNTTRSGVEERFTDLRFHGAGGTALEMRVFGYDDLCAGLEKAGFTSIETVRRENVPFGIRLPHAWSLPMVARKPENRKGRSRR